MGYSREWDMSGIMADVPDHGLSLHDGDVVGGGPMVEVVDRCLEGAVVERAVVNTVTNNSFVDVLPSTCYFYS